MRTAVGFLMVLCVLILTVNPVVASERSRPAWVTALVGKEFVLRVSVNTNPYVYAFDSGGAIVAHLEGDLFPLFQDEPATITKAEVKNRQLAIKIRGAYLGDAEVTIYRDGESDSLLADDCSKVLGIIARLDDRPLFYARNDRHTLHYAGSNHCPPEDRSRGYRSLAVAVADSLSPCESCFSGIAQLPDLGEEVALGLTMSREIRSTYTASLNPSKQQRLLQIGNKVLSAWPLPLRGYEYRFALVDMQCVNALACPAGHVFVSEQLYDMCETDLELESIIAHEIAHVEMRHGLRQLNRAKRDAGILSIFGAVVGAVISDDKTGTGAILGAVTGVGLEVALKIAQSGYSRDMEEESDSYAVNYLVHVMGDEARKEYASALRKLEYYEEARSQKRAEEGSLDTHPGIPRRVRFATDSRVTPLVPPRVFIALDTLGVEVMRIGIESVVVYEWTEAKEVTRRDRDSKLEQPEEVVVTTFCRDISVFGFAEAKNRIARDYELKDLVAEYGSIEVKLDNKEDTTVRPGGATSLYVFRKERTEAAPEPIGDGVPLRFRINAGRSRVLVFEPA